MFVNPTALLDQSDDTLSTYTFSDISSDQIISVVYYDPSSPVYNVTTSGENIASITYYYNPAAVSGPTEDCVNKNNQTIDQMIRPGSAPGFADATYVSCDVKAGGSITVEYTIASGFHLTGVTIDGAPAETIANSYTFDNLSADHVIRLTSEKDGDVTPVDPCVDDPTAEGCGGPDPDPVTLFLQDFDPVKMLPNIGDTTTLTDQRDGKTYRVRRLKDGKVWMVDDLALKNVLLTPADSNVYSNFALPDSSSASNLNKNNIQRAVVYDSGDTVYYNLLAALAGYPYYSFSEEFNPGDATSPRDICPKGWHMPTQIGTGGEVEGDFPGLIVAYGSGSPSYSVNSAVIELLADTNGPAFAYTGAAYEKGLYSVGEEGLWLSSTFYTDSFSSQLLAARGLSISGKQVSAHNAFGNVGGYTVRCVAGDYKDVALGPELDVETNSDTTPDGGGDNNGGDNNNGGGNNSGDNGNSGGNNSSNGDNGSSNTPVYYTVDTDGVAVPNTGHRTSEDGSSNSVLIGVLQTALAVIGLAGVALIVASRHRKIRF